MADARPGDVAVVVDVLSFTTTLTVAVEHGIAVHPYPWAREAARRTPPSAAPTLAVGRRAGLADGHGEPVAGVVRRDVAGIDRVVLPVAQRLGDLPSLSPRPG